MHTHMHAYIHTQDCRENDCFIIMCTCMRTSRRICVCIRKCMHTYIHTQKIVEMKIVLLLCVRVWGRVGDYVYAYVNAYIHTYTHKIVEKKIVLCSEKRILNIIWYDVYATCYLYYLISCECNVLFTGIFPDKCTLVTRHLCVLLLMFVWTSQGKKK